MAAGEHKTMQKSSRLQQIGPLASARSREVDPKLIHDGPKNILFQFIKTRIKVKLTAIFGHPDARRAALQHFQCLILGQLMRMTCS